ncbi:MAG: hypothetical protein WDN27_02830 [Candidatus Saccharibacteria bacterium]
MADRIFEGLLLEAGKKADIEFADPSLSEERRAHIRQGLFEFACMAYSRRLEEIGNELLDKVMGGGGVPLTDVDILALAGHPDTDKSAA